MTARIEYALYLALLEMLFNPRLQLPLYGFCAGLNTLKLYNPAIISLTIS
jgi:hypothetical protein